MFSYQYELKRKYFFKIMERWQETVDKVARMAEFNDREVGLMSQQYNNNQLILKYLYLTGLCGRSPTVFKESKVSENAQRKQ